jgi:hypothetical protein
MRRVAWSENMLRDDLSAWEQAQAVLAAQRELESAGDPSNQRAVAEEVGLSLGSANELLRIAKAFSPGAVAQAQLEGDEPPLEGTNGHRAPSIHDIPRDHLTRAAKLGTMAERDAWLRQRLEGGRPKSSSRPRRTSISVPLDPASCSPSRAREMTLMLVMILPDLIRRGARDPADAQALGTAAAAFCLERLGGPSLEELTGESGTDSDTETWLRELRRHAADGSPSKPAA